MDTASLIGALTSVDANSLKPVLFGAEDLVSGVFAAVTGSINGGVGAFAGIAGLIQSGLGSVGGM